MTRTIRRKIWLTPVPLVGIRAVATRKKVGWMIVARRGDDCYRFWSLNLPDHCERAPL